jgi:hypothetical protein
METIELSVIKQMVKENPNDMELGKKIRQMILDIKNQTYGVQQEDIKKR